MKKGKVLGKGQITVAVMLLALGAAIWLNAKYIPSDTKYLGEASYVSGSAAEEEAVATSAKAENSSEDYFTTAKKERDSTLKEACETIEEMLKSDKLTAEDKKSAVLKIEEIGSNMTKEANIEALLKAKGFEKTLAVISDSGISIIVLSDGLTSAQTLQIQDIATQEAGVTLANVKIIPIA